MAMELMLSGLYYLSKISKGMHSIKRALGPAQSVLATNDANIWQRRRDLQGITWRVGFVPFIPMLFVDEDTGAPFGYSYEVWKLIEKALNVTSVLVNARSFGKMGADGQWGGVVGMASRGELDITFSSMSTTFSR